MSPSVLIIHDLVSWLIVWNIIGIVIMGWDKFLAWNREGKADAERVSERTLHGIAAVGGFLGIICGGPAFHHKTSKVYFWPPVVLAVLIWVLLIYYVITLHLLPFVL